MLFLCIGSLPSVISFMYHMYKGLLMSLGTPPHWDLFITWVWAHMRLYGLGGDAFYVLGLQLDGYHEFHSPLGAYLPLFWQSTSFLFQPMVFHLPMVFHPWYFEEEMVLESPLSLYIWCIRHYYGLWPLNVRKCCRIFTIKSFFGLFTLA